MSEGSQATAGLSECGPADDASFPREAEGSLPATRGDERSFTPSIEPPDRREGSQAEPPGRPGPVLSRSLESGGTTDPREGNPPDFPAPPAASDPEVFRYDESDPFAESFPRFGRRLASTGNFYRRSEHGGGVLLVLNHFNAPPVDLDDTTRFQAAIADNLRVEVMRGGEAKRGQIANAHLKIMSRSELFLRELPAVDEVVNGAVYRPSSFCPTTPGYNDRGLGHCVLHIGPPARVVRTLDALRRFFGAIPFESAADLANAYAAAVTVMLRNFWPGGKPIIVVGANKSHAGKTTLISGITGSTPSNSVTFQRTGWAMERSMTGALLHDPRIGVLNIDNARLEGGASIESAFLERFLTDPRPFLFSTGTGRPARPWNNVVISMTTNEGFLSVDLMNRSLPIWLHLRGNATDRHSPLGNLRHEFLPQYREQMEAEVHGMIANWVDAGCPLATDVRHSALPWAQTVGGILQANGIEHFLENLDARHNTDDPVRRSLGLLGAARPDEDRTASEWSEIISDLGLVKSLTPPADRDGKVALARGAGVTLSAHLDEVLDVATEDHVYKLRLEKARKRFPGDPNPRTKYRFRVLHRGDIPADV